MGDLFSHLMQRQVVSRAWTVASELTAAMFGTVAAIGGLDVQLCYYRGHDECTATRWHSDARALTAINAAV